MKKRTIAILLALLMLMSVLITGCGSSTNSADNSAGEQSTAEDNQPAEDTEDVADTEETDDQVYTLIVSETKGDNACPGFLEYLNKIEEASNGRIKFDIYLNGSLLKVAEIPQALATGVADIVEFDTTEFPNLFPLAQLVSLPFIGITDKCDEVYAALYDEFEEVRTEVEAANMHLLGSFIGSPTNLHLATTKSVTEPSDLNGLKLISTNPYMQEFIQLCGGAPVASDPGDFYSNLDKGVVDGIFVNYGMMHNMGIYPATKQTVAFSEVENSGCFQTLNFYAMSQSTWDSLPEDLQQLFIDFEPELHEADKEKLGSYYDLSLNDIEEAGNDFSTINDEQLAVWTEAFEPITEQAVADLDDAGLPGTAVYERMIELIDEANNG